MEKSEQINELALALAKAQLVIENASKNAENPHFRSKYADLAEILNTARPVLAEHGLSISQFPSYDNGIAYVETILMHQSGQWLSSVASAPVSKQDAQGVGSCITYLRRYSYAAVAGLAQEDDDANSAVGKNSTQSATQYQGKPTPKKGTLTLEDAVQLVETASTIDSLKKLWSTMAKQFKTDLTDEEYNHIEKIKDAKKVFFTDNN